MFLILVYVHFKRRSSAPSQVAKRALQDDDSSPKNKKSPLSIKNRNTFTFLSPSSTHYDNAQSPEASQISNHVG